MEKAYNERDKQNSASYMTEYINHFLENEPTPGIEWEYNFSKNTLLKKINLQIINRYAQNLATEKNLIVDISGPDNAKESIPTEAERLDTRVRETIRGKEREQAAHRREQAQAWTRDKAGVQQQTRNYRTDTQQQHQSDTQADRLQKRRDTDEGFELRRHFDREGEKQADVVRIRHNDSHKQRFRQVL